MGYIGEVLGGVMFWQLWSELLLEWNLTKRYWFDQVAGLSASVLFFYSMVLGLENLTPEGLASLGLDVGPLLLLFAAFSMVVGTFQSVAYGVQSEAAQGTLEHLGLARGGLLWQLLLRSFVVGLEGIATGLLVLLPLALLLGVRLAPAPWWPLGLLLLYLAALGFALAMGALALYFKRVDGFFTIVQFLFLPYFFSLVRFEPWMAPLPFAPGAYLLRMGLTGEGPSLALVGLAAFQALLFLVLGFVAMSWVYALVRRRGIFGRY
jgi:ABC-2 type transport system permease protein